MEKKQPNKSELLQQDTKASQEKYRAFQAEKSTDWLLKLECIIDDNAVQINGAAIGLNSGIFCLSSNIL